MLVQHGADQQVPIASITKLMTVLVALERTEPDDVVVVDRRAAAVGESTIHLRAGERVTVHDLVEAALIQSANDAANALALHVSGSVPAFAELMNRKAAQLGLRDTHFVRPDGLDVAGHVSSARDVTKLARVAMNDPTVRSIVRLRNAEAAGRHLFTWNDLLGRFPGLIGVKTGHTSAAGWSQVAAARGRGLTVYATILGAPTRSSRNADLSQLLAWGLSRYRVVPLVQEGRVYARASAAVREGAGRARRLPSGREGRPDRASARGADRRARCPSSCRCGRGSASASSGSTTDASSSPRARSSRGGASRRRGGCRRWAGTRRRR